MRKIKILLFLWQLLTTIIKTMAITTTTQEITTTTIIYDTTTTIQLQLQELEEAEENGKYFINDNFTRILLSPGTTTLPTKTITITFHQYCLAHRNSAADILTLCLYASVCLIGLFGNTLVIYVVLRFSKMQTVTNIYILNLAVADECFLIGIPFLLYTMRICSWDFGQYACKAYMVSTSITQFTSSIFLLIMSADRYLAVCHPIVSPRFRTLRNAKWVSWVAWLTSVVLMLPVLLFANTVVQEDGVHVSCNIKWPDAFNRHSGTTFIIYTFALGFATPLCFIMSFYCLVIRKLRRVGPKQRSKEKRRSHRKVTRLVLTVITVYVLCWLPHWVSQVALISSNPEKSDLSRLEILLYLLLGCLAYSNSAMNPLLYAFLSENFRKSFSKAFSCMSVREINADFQPEPSIYTTKQMSRKRSAARLPLTTTRIQVIQGNNTGNTSILPGAGGGGGAQGATTTTAHLRTRIAGGGGGGTRDYACDSGNGSGSGSGSNSGTGANLTTTTNSSAGNNNNNNNNTNNFNSCLMLEDNSNATTSTAQKNMILQTDL